MKKTVAISVVLGLLLVSAGLVLAQAGPGANVGPAFGRVWAQLKLTDDQRKQLQDLRLKMAKETLPLRNKLGVKRLELKELMNADTPNVKAIEAKIDEIKKLEASLQKKRVEHRLAVRGILTPEQREQLAKLRSMRGMRHFGKRGMRRPHHPRGHRMMPGRPLHTPGPMAPGMP